MEKGSLQELQYPIGQFEVPQDSGAGARANWIAIIEETPARLREAVAGLEDGQLDTPYRPEGWTARQVVHHMADSHMNAYIRFKLALTEDTPTIRPYNEVAWAELPEAKTGTPELSLTLLETLHRRWVACLRAMREADFKRTFRHSDLGIVPLDVSMAHYAWHSRHHVAHVMNLRERNGW